MVKIRLEGITKYFERVKALDNLSLEFPDGSFSTILGPPGAGKTTLLRVIGGVEKADEGRIYFDEVEVTHLPPKHRNVSLVFQTFALWPHMNVYDNIASPLKARKIPQSEMDRKVKETAELLRISHLLNKYPPYLSGGERQRVAMARALIREAKVYMFDEPLTNVDYKIREEMRGEFRRLFKEYGGTIIYATPDPIDVFTMSQHVAVIDRGKLVQIGRTSDVYNRPRTVFIAAYLGFPRMELMPAEIASENGKMFLKTQSFVINVSQISHLLNKGKEYLIGVRPDKLRIVYPEKRRMHVKELISFKAEILICEVIGSETIVHLDAQGSKLTMYVPDIIRMLPAEKITVSFNPDDIYVFDKDSGELIYTGGSGQ